jgi:hypothetical protein
MQNKTTAIRNFSSLPIALVVAGDGRGPLQLVPKQ